MVKVLTAKFVENEKATDKRKEIPDAGIVGLRLIVQPTGDKSWTYRYVFGGKKKRLSLGKFPLVQLSQAREMARVAALKLSEGTDPAWKPPAPEPEKPANLFEDVARTYLRRCCRPNHGARHLKETARLFGFALDGDAYSRNGYAKSFCNKWGDRPVASLTYIDLQDFLDDVIDSGTPIQAINMYQALGAFFRWCEGRAIVERNPMLKIRQPAKKNVGKRVLSDAELRALWRAADRLGYPQGSAYKLLMLSGQRKSIVALAQAAQIDRRAGLWVIEDDQEGAKGTGHILPVTPGLAAIFDECNGSAPYLFSTTSGDKPLTIGGKIKTKVDALMLHELRAEAEERGDAPASVTLKEWDNHDIRRTMRTRLSALPVPEGDVVRELVIGHRQGKLHQIYDKHLYLEQKAIALDLWAARLADIVEPQKGKVVRYKPKEAR